jgi:hypothetical protein
MKAIRTVPQDGHNPAFDARAYALARIGGPAYDQQPTLVYPVGSVIEGRAALRACLQRNPKAVPFDAECMEAFQKALATPGLKERMEAIRNRKAVIEQLPKRAQAEYRAAIDHWDGSQLQKLILGEVPMPTIDQVEDEAEAEQTLDGEE